MTRVAYSPRSMAGARWCGNRIHARIGRPSAPGPHPFVMTPPPRSGPHRTMPWILAAAAAQFQVASARGPQFRLPPGSGCSGAGREGFLSGEARGGAGDAGGRDEGRNSVVRLGKKIEEPNGTMVFCRIMRFGGRAKRSNKKR
jgi:hypothetical protein